MASHLSSQHVSHSSTPAHAFTGMPAAPGVSLPPKLPPQEQQPAQQTGVQVLQVCTNITDAAAPAAVQAMQYML